ncbi:MAG: FadR/GntR family transcriptional regulator [Candidatus Bipolaricaulota bacterium]|nr:FadR family transcriptional regulator [Candidatus Bipolaricaulota bacterium]
MKKSSQVSFGKSKKTLTQQIIEEISSDIREGELGPGEKLPSEKELRERFDVGRSSIREALHALVALGVLESHAGKGYYVSDNYSLPLENSLLFDLVLEEEDFYDMVELREVLEKQIGIMAIQRATEENIQRVKLAVKEMQEALERGEELINFTTQIHVELARASHNSMAVRVMELLLPLIVSKAKQALIPPERDCREHERLARAFLVGDAEKMKKEVSDHLDYLRERFTEVHDEKAEGGRSQSNGDNE